MGLNEQLDRRWVKEVKNSLISSLNNSSGADAITEFGNGRNRGTRQEKREKYWDGGNKSD